MGLVRFVRSLWLVLLVGWACGGEESVGDSAAPSPAPSPPSPRADGSSGDVVVPPPPKGTRCDAPERPPSASRIELVDAFPNLSFSRPMGLFQAPGDDTRWYVVEQTGSIRVFANDPKVRTTTELLAEPLGADLGTTEEGGLLGFAFHPDYATNGAAFLAYTVRVPGSPGLTQRIARFRRNAAGTLSKDADIFERHSPPRSLREEHNLGTIAFGADGLLYIALGDAYVAGDDPMNPAQNPASVFGKILRIAVGETGPYQIPEGNPYRRGGGAPEIYALGFRNPWRFSFDREKPGDLWVGDVGDRTWEEIDKVEVGKNYGWSVMEGAHCHGPGTCNRSGLELPVVEYARHGGLLAVIGGYVYRGTQYPWLRGTYFYADFNGRIWSLPNGRPPAEIELDTQHPMMSFSQANDGELYILKYEAANAPAKIYRLAGTPQSRPSTFPQTLRATGCVDPDDPTKPRPELVPFDVNSPLWSDGADKRRWLSLPPGARIHVRADGDLELPLGSVVMKEFRLNGKPVETRLLVRHADGEWGGYSYEWKDDGTDAQLLEREKTTTIGGQSWFFPGRGQCFSCHTVEAGRTLGLEIGQLNRGDQLRRLAELFDAPVVGDLPRYPDPFGNDPIDARARAYLHANCSFCHRPHGTGRALHNLLFSAGLAKMNVCDVVQTGGNLGVSNARLLAPGDPARSLLSVRMKSLNETRMPPLATTRVDDAATKLIDDWIRGIRVCP